MDIQTNTNFLLLKLLQQWRESYSVQWNVQSILFTSHKLFCVFPTHSTNSEYLLIRFIYKSTEESYQIITRLNAIQSRMTNKAQLLMNTDNFSKWF